MDRLEQRGQTRDLILSATNVHLINLCLYLYTSPFHFAVFVLLSFITAPGPAGALQVRPPLVAALTYLNRRHL